MHPQGGLLWTFLLAVSTSQEGLWKQRFQESAPPGAMRHPDSEPLQPCVTVGQSPPRCNWIAWRSAAARPPRMWGEENVKMMDMRARLLGWVSLGLSAVPTSPPSAHQGSPAPYSQPISPRSLTKMKISGGDRARRERPNPSAQATPTYTPTHTHSPTHLWRLSLEFYSDSHPPLHTHLLLPLTPISCWGCAGSFQAVYGG